MQIRQRKNMKKKQNRCNGERLKCETGKKEKTKGEMEKKQKTNRKKKTRCDGERLKCETGTKEKIEEEMQKRQRKRELKTG